MHLLDNKPNQSGSLSLILPVLLILLVVGGFILYNAKISQKPKPTPSSPQPLSATISNQPQLVPAANPVSIDTSSWKTYTNLTDGISIKVPPQFLPNFPAKSASPIQLNPDKSIRWDYEDLSGDLTGNYAFNVRINSGQNHIDKACTTDDECFSVLYDFYKSLPNTELFLLHAKILNRDIKGLGIANKDGTPDLVPSDAGIIYDMYFEFIHNGKSYELNINSNDNYDQLLEKQPYIDGVAATISFSK